MPAFAAGQKWPAIAVHWRWAAWAAAALLVAGIPWLVWSGYLPIDVVGAVYGMLASLPLALAFATIYFFPTVIAAVRGHREVFAILVLNTFLGWTYLGWVMALVWASLSKVR